MSRPKKKQADKRTYVAAAYLTKKEMAKVKADAKANGFSSIAGYARQLLLE